LGKELVRLFSSVCITYFFLKFLFIENDFQFRGLIKSLICHCLFGQIGKQDFFVRFLKILIEAKDCLNKLVDKTGYK